jgi:hypothetical protein
MVGIVVGSILILFCIALFIADSKGVIQKEALDKLVKISKIATFVLAVVAFTIPFLSTTPTPTSPVTITNMDWQPWVQGNNGSLITSLIPVTGSDKAIEVSFNLLTDDWVAIYKKLDRGSLSGMGSVRIAYRGTGPRNTFEFKLIDKYGTIFECVWAGATDTGGQVAFREVSLDECLCRKGEGRCQDDDDVGSLALNPKYLDRIDLGFSNRQVHGDDPGSVTMVIEEILVVP